MLKRTHTFLKETSSSAMTAVRSRLPWNRCNASTPASPHQVTGLTKWKTKLSKYRPLIHEDFRTADQQLWLLGTDAKRTLDKAEELLASTEFKEEDVKKEVRRLRQSIRFLRSRLNETDVFMAGSNNDS